MKCPSAEELAAHLDGGLGPQAAAAIVEHLEVCDRCRQLVADALEGLGRPPDHRGEPGRRRPCP